MVMRRLIQFATLTALSAALFTPPLLAQDTKDEAKTLGKKGIYGRNTVEEDTGTYSQQADPEANRKLMKKYPLSITSHTEVNQAAQNFVLRGIKSYNTTKLVFDAVQEITSTYEPSTTILRIKQQGIVTARLQPRDILEYGPTNAYLALRIRGLQQADKEISYAISQFNQARSLVPSSSSIQKWVRVANDTKKVIAYHIRFYQVTGKAVKLGLTDAQMNELAERWNRGYPPRIAPEETLTTRVKTGFYDRDGDENTKGSLNFDSVKGRLPNLEFSVGDL